MNVTLVSVGTLKEKYWQDAFAEYAKRVGTYAKFEEYNVKEERITDENNQEEIKAALDAEAKKILPKMTKDAYKIALCVEGKSLSSEEFAAVIDRARNASGKLVLVIGSSHGLSDGVKAAADLRLSVSDMTFPHQLMRVMVAEMVYRGFTILAGKTYHK